MITKHEERLSGGSGVICIEQKYHACLFSLKDKHRCGLIFIIFEKKKKSVYEESPEMILLGTAKLTIVGLSDKPCGSSHDKLSGNPFLNSCKSMLVQAACVRCHRTIGPSGLRALSRN